MDLEIFLFLPQNGAICFVNGRKVDSAIVLKTGSRVILGKNHVFRFNHPEQAREQRMTESTMVASSASNVDDDVEGGDRHADWDYAHEELMAKQGIDLKAEMAKKLKEIEEIYIKEKVKGYAQCW